VKLYLRAFARLGQPPENPVRPNAVSFYVWNPAGKLGSGSRVDEPEELQVWTHFAATINVAADRIRIYKNGEFKDGDTLSSFSVIPRDGDAPLCFGTMNFDSYFVGSIDNVMIYNRELSASEVMQVYLDTTR
jgi:Concanavalin A-like lectin/glucanases superfamily